MLESIDSYDLLKEFFMNPRFFLIPVTFLLTNIALAETTSYSCMAYFYTKSNKQNLVFSKVTTINHQFDFSTLTFDQDNSSWVDLGHDEYQSTVQSEDLKVIKRFLRSSSKYELSTYIRNEIQSVQFHYCSEVKEDQFVMP